MPSSTRLLFLLLMFHLQLKAIGFYLLLPPPQSKTVSHDSCINYNPSTRTIIVSCSSPARLTNMDSKLHDSSNWNLEGIT